MKISEILEALPKDTVLRLCCIKLDSPDVLVPPGVEITPGETEGIGVAKETFGDLQKLAQDFLYRHVLFMAGRPGAAYFCRYLELTYFPPDDPSKNDLFDMRYFKWNDLHWCIVSVRTAFDSVLHETAKITNMRLVDRALPVMIGDGKIERLPLHDEFLYTMENDSSHILYSQGQEAAYKQEDELVEALEKEKLTPHIVVEGKSQ